MADNVVIYHVTFNTVIYEANLLTGTYFPFADWDRFQARQRALTRAGIPFKTWEGNPSSMDQEFGKELVVAPSVQAIANQVAFLYTNETFRDAKGQINLPYSKTAANFEDVRAVSAKVDALSKKLDDVLAALAAAKK